MKRITLLSLFILGLTITFTSCIKDLVCIEGEGPIINRTLDLDEFTAINSIGSATVYIEEGEEQSVEVSGHENIIEKLESEVKAGTWRIELEDGFCYTDYELTIYITTPDIEEISISGSADIYISDFSGIEELEINITGSGDVEFEELTGVEVIDIDITGSGDIRFNEEIDNLNTLTLDISGSGDLEAFKAETINCDIQISGSGNCEVYVLEKLDVKISGSGNIYYRGNPYITTDISGNGDLINAN